jgi:hypothetical protein
LLLLLLLLLLLCCVLSTCRRQKDIQKLSQAILLVNDQRLMALRIWEHQQQQLQSS